MIHGTKTVGMYYNYTSCNLVIHPINYLYEIQFKIQMHQSLYLLRIYDFVDNYHGYSLCHILYNKLHYCNNFAF